MTDNEIINNLERCASYSDKRECGDCPYIGSYQCVVKMMKDSLALINRQKAEIERLQKNEQIATVIIEESSAEIEKKNTEIDILISKKDTLQDENSELTAEVESLKEALKNLKIQMSYMVNPNSIGDRHEMGCW